MEKPNPKPRIGVQQKFEDACAYAEDQINRWGKLYRETRGRRMIEMMDEIAVLLEMAQRGYRVKTSLHEADARLAALFRLLRRCNRTQYSVVRRKDGKPLRDAEGKVVTDTKKLVEDHTYGVWAERMVEIGKMLGGWIKAVEAVPHKENRNEDGRA